MVQWSVDPQTYRELHILTPEIRHSGMLKRFDASLRYVMHGRIPSWCGECTIVEALSSYSGHRRGYCRSLLQQLHDFHLAQTHKPLMKVMLAVQV
jgi:hypothetical protein